MKSVLVTGATGTVGRQVVSQLLAADCRLRAMTRNPDRAGLPPQVEAVRGDLTDPDALERCLDGIKAGADVPRLGDRSRKGVPILIKRTGAQKEAAKTSSLPKTQGPLRFPRSTAGAT